jgi:hypothetical protein
MAVEEIAQLVQSQFERAGAILQTNPHFKETYDLDFTVAALSDVHAHVNLGVHVTVEADDLASMQKFSQIAARGIVFKSLYVELSEVASKAGGAIVGVAAAMAFLFNRRFQQSKLMGLRIHDDCSFQFFDLVENIERLDRVYVDEDLVVGDSLGGRIIAYFTDKGFGFIQTDDERKFFFHIANVVDDELRGKLPSYVLGEIIPVEFHYGGNDGKKYPKAIHVSLTENLSGDSDYYDYDSEVFEA